MRKLLLATVFGLGMMASAHADLIYNFDVTQPFSGDAGTGSLTADFKTMGSGTVQLTLSGNLTGTEFVLPSDGFYFNIDPNINPTSITVTGSQVFAPITSATVSLGTNAFKPDGDGLMDMQITFDPNSAKPATGTFAIITLQGTGLTENSFNFLSDCSQGCGTGAHYAAVHVGNTANGTSSAWVGGNPQGTPVNEPATLAILGTAILGLGIATRKSRQRGSFTAAV
jgi:hypothetical protein